MSSEEKSEKLLPEELMIGKKAEILLKAYPDIEERLQKMSHNGPQAYGYTFESLAIHERLTNRIETSKQKVTRVIIDEILEMKTSEKRLLQGLGKKQPQKTINTIEMIVADLNTIIDGKPIEDIKPKENIGKVHSVKRKEFLNKIKTKIISEEITDKISLSKDLKYVVVLPYGQDANPVNLQLTTQDGQSVGIEITNSLFSITDIVKVLDHHAETASE